MNYQGIMANDRERSQVDGQLNASDGKNMNKYIPSWLEAHASKLNESIHLKNSGRKKIIRTCKQIGLSVRPFLNWLVLGGLLFFFTQALTHHWQEVAAIRIDGMGWVYLAIAIVVELLAFTWSGWVWGYILQDLKQPMRKPWAIKVYLTTHIAKYLPGSVWHYYGRIWTIKAAGGCPKVATISIVIESLLMVAAALLTTLFFSQFSGTVSPGNWNSYWQFLCLAVVLMVVHPWILNPILRFLGKRQDRKKGTASHSAVSCEIEGYPLKLLLGELGFIGLRCGGFLLTFMAMVQVHPGQLPMLINAFTLSWLASLVIPGAPGGVGVFEAGAIALLQQPFSTGIVLSVVALFRLVTILAEAAGAGVAWLDNRRCM